MNKKFAISSAALIVSIIVAVFAINRIAFYADHLLNASEYPSTLLENMVVYKIDATTILTSLDQGKTNVFIPAPYQNPIYDDVPVLKFSPPLSWTQEDFLKVANALHEYVWKESLANYQLYSLRFGVPECNGIFRVDNAGFQFYQRQRNWHYIVHNITIDLQHGYVYAGDNNGYYTGQWEDVDLHSAMVNDAGKALLIADQNGGWKARLPVQNDPNCSISIDFPPAVYERTTLKWDVTYWLYSKKK